MKTTEIRDAFLNFFQDKQHEIVDSSPVVPGNDPTLLFTNAGMVQFKDVFLGEDKRSYTRATSSQCCIRAGGKHNDLENVGYTARHHTFFEMLGNFSFGDYFKRDAIQFAWDFLTQVLKLPEEKLWVTVYQDDDEAADIWLKELKVSDKRFSRCGEKDNFWSMGDTGPCGPCSEIFYDHGPEIPGGPPGTPEEDGDRYIEIWNLVFMQYNRDKSGTLTPLPKPSVDTGMGLERIAAVMQSVHSNYEIDLFQDLIKAAAKLTGCDDLGAQSLRVIADHIRACAFMILDGVLPSNEGRGYVLRRIIRRALRHGNKLGATDHFFHQLMPALVAAMGGAYPRLASSQAHIEKVLSQEEAQFERTLDQGLKILEQSLETLSDKTIPGEILFTLYDTYGFPLDLTADIARERGYAVDSEGFESCMSEQRERARAASQFSVDYNDTMSLSHEVDFIGYELLDGETTLQAIYQEGNEVKELPEGANAWLVLKRTPFYAESGGQVGDVGKICFAEGWFEVQDTQKVDDTIVHIGQLKQGTLKSGCTVFGEIDRERRRAIMRHHSATHLMHAALRELLGDQLVQKGSLVDDKRLRFDFSHYEAVTPEQFRVLEKTVNEQILKNTEVSTQLMTMKEAKAAGAMALFGEKYGDTVRVLSMGGTFSVELCGGTHVARTGDIGLFKIVSESSVASGIRRIEAVAGERVIELLHSHEAQLSGVGQLLKTDPDRLIDKVSQLLGQVKQLEKSMAQLSGKLASAAGDDLISQAKDINGVKVLAAKLTNTEPKALRDVMDKLKDKLGTAVVALGVEKSDGKVALIAGVTSDCTQRVKAGELVNMIATQVGGKGGGRPDMAQAGGTDAANLQAALDSVYEWVSDKL